MINLRRLFEIWFESERVSFTELMTYTAEHLPRLIAGNVGGALDARITATTVAYTAMEGGMTDDLAKLSFQKGRTLAKKTFREALPEGMARIHGAVVAAYGPNGADTLECFPEGRSIFSTCRDEQLDNKLANLVLKLTPRQAQVGATAVTSATALSTTWASLFGAQGTAKAQKEMSDDARAAARQTLELELYLNVHTLAMMFPGDTAKCDLYCPQHLLRNAQHADAPEDAELEAGAYNAVTQKLTLTLHSADATHFDLLRRVVGAPDLAIIAGNLAATTGGNATYEDTIAPGDYEYQAVPKKNGVAGGESDLVTVNAA